MHAGECQGFGTIDPLDGGMAVRASDKGRMQLIA
jgi:hypothetical protein